MKSIDVIKTDRGIVEYQLIGNGPVVLFVHGGHSSCRGDFKQNLLAEHGFCVLTPSRPGYGKTPIESGKTAQDTAHLLAALANKLNIESLSVIGNSAGGPTALEYARLYPDMVDKLVLEAAVVKPWFHRLTPQYYGVKVVFNPKRQQGFWDNLKKKLTDNEEKVLISNIRRFTKLKPKDVIANMDESAIEAIKYYMVTGNNSGEGFVFDVEHRAKNIETIVCPTLIIHSKNDGCVKFDHAQYANRKIKNSELYAAPCDSHFIYLGANVDQIIQKRVSFLLDKAV